MNVREQWNNVMATFGEIVYGVLDRVKLLSDDAYFTEEHVLLLAKTIRSMLLTRKYKGARNKTFSVMSQENQQQVCLMLEPADLLPQGCQGKWLRSTAVVPDFLDEGQPVACTGHDLMETVVTFIPRERMPYVGYNKWLKNIIYASRSIDGHLYLRGSNPQFVMLERIGLTGIFSDPEAAAALSHEACMSGKSCDVIADDVYFPLEAALVPTLIDLIVQELSGSVYAPEDKNNNASDDLAGLAVRRKAAPDTIKAERNNDDYE